MVDDLLDLRDWTRSAPRPEKDRVLACLAELARDDHAAAVTLVWLLLPGAITLADRLRDLSPEIDALVAGQMWIEVARSQWLPPQGIARAILNSTRWELTAALGVGHHAKLRDRIWSEVALLDHFEERAVLADMAKGRLRRKIPDLARALEGHFDDHHARLAGSILHRLDLVDRALVELDQVITAQCQPWAHQIELLQTIPGVGERVAQVIGRDRRGHVPVPLRGAPGRLGRPRAGDV